MPARTDLRSILILGSGPIVIGMNPRVLRSSALASKATGFPIAKIAAKLAVGYTLDELRNDITREELERYMRLAVEASPERPILMDRFLEDATEVDVDAIADGKTCRIGGIMEHIEEAGVHSGDSCCVLPPPTLPVAIVEEIRRATYALAARLGVRGLMNIQFAIQGDRVYVLEVDPRASRTSPFVSKATGVPLAKIAARVMAGLTLDEAGFTGEPWPAYYSVKEPVFPFARFPGCDVLLGPEMRPPGRSWGWTSTSGGRRPRRSWARGRISRARGVSS